MEVLEGLRKDGVLNTPFIALEALGALSGAMLSGRAEAEMQTTWPKEWGNETITLPLSLILALRSGWDDYRQAPTGRSFGEALQIEGGGQGNHSMKAKLATIDRARGLANQIEINYIEIEGDQTPMRLDNAIHEVALANSVSFETAKAAHKAHRNDIRDALTDLELLKGVKPS
tara:strand:- start:112941 stop:113459 length:519 start_codon:yes stop_codon:yes gene_type:complete